MLDEYIRILRMGAQHQGSFQMTPELCRIFAELLTELKMYREDSMVRRDGESIR